MEPWLATLIIVVPSVGLVCVTTVIVHWLRRKQARTAIVDQAALARLQEEFALLRTQTQDQLNELHERLDFSERLLTQSMGAAQRQSESHTPV